MTKAARGASWRPSTAASFRRRGLQVGWTSTTFFMEESVGSEVHTGWDPPVAFASDELVIAPPGFSEEPSPPGHGSEPGDASYLPSPPNLDSSPERVKAKDEVGEEGGAVETQPESASHLVGPEPEPEEDILHSHLPVLITILLIKLPPGGHLLQSVLRAAATRRAYRSS